MRRFLLLFLILLLMSLSGCRSTGAGDPPRGAGEEARSEPGERLDAEERVLGLAMLPGASPVDSMMRLDEGTAVYETDEPEARIRAFFVEAIGSEPVVRRLSDRVEHLWEGTDDEGAWMLRLREVPEAMKGRPFLRARSLVYSRPQQVGPGPVD